MNKIYDKNYYLNATAAMAALIQTGNYTNPYHLATTAYEIADAMFEVGVKKVRNES